MLQTFMFREVLMNEKYKKMLFDFILNADRVKASELLDGLGLALGYTFVLKEILEPVLLEIGERWQNDLSLAHGYIAGKTAEDFLLKASQSSDFKRTRKPKGSVVLGNIEGDYHALGRKMLGIFLTAAGWDVYDLGNDVVSSDFIDKAIEVNAQIIGVSSMIYSTALNIKKIRKEINNRNLNHKIILAVGGAVFNLRSELFEEVGGDITAKNAIEADNVFMQALNKIKL